MHRGGQRPGARAQPQDLVRHTRTIRTALPPKLPGFSREQTITPFAPFSTFPGSESPKKTESNQLKGNQSNSFAAERGGQALHDLLLSPRPQSLRSGSAPH